MTRQDLLAALAAWNPDDDLPDDVARALDHDPALRAAFDARFPRAPLPDAPPAHDPAFLVDRVAPTRGREVWKVLAVALPIAAACLLAVGAVFSTAASHGGRALPPRAEAPVQVVEIDLPGRAPDAVPAGWSDLRAALRTGALPRPDAVRVDAALRALPSTDPAPVGGPFAVATDAVPTPWNPATHLVRVGLRAGAAGRDGDVVARGVTLAVDWDPAAVRWARRVADVAPAPDVTVEALHAGEHLTALYEVALAPGADGALGTVHLRFDEATGVAADHAWPVRADAAAWEDAGHDLRLAVSVAAFAGKLRGEVDDDALAWADLDGLVADATDPGVPLEAELRDLVGRAARLARN